MKTLITLAAVLALCASPLAVHADPSGVDTPVEDGLVTGLLDSVNALEGIVVMDGVSYLVPGSVADLTQFSRGDAVILGYVRNETGAYEALSLRKQELG